MVVEWFVNGQPLQASEFLSEFGRVSDLFIVIFCF